MSALHIENDRIALTTDNPAGQMFSLTDKRNNEEILYQADEGWSGRNPSLFPMVGSTWKNGSYEWGGKTYAMKNHGLIRYEDLDGTISEDGKSIVYTFDSSEKTRAQYPFDFHFVLSYTLEENGVRVDYAITNTGLAAMPFSFGLHPAFRTVRGKEEAFEDFSIHFDPVKEAEQIVFFDDLSAVERKPLTLDTWNLSYEDLKQYATLVFDKIGATSATLFYKDQPRLRVDFEGFPSVALWNKGEGNTYICIEPWFGHADFEKVEVPFDKREGTLVLPAGETFKASYTITPLS